MKEVLIREEVEAVTELKQLEDETPEAYILRVIFAIDKLSDEDWNLLSKKAQRWVNSNVDRLKKKKIPIWFTDEIKKDLNKKKKKEYKQNYNLEQGDFVDITQKNGTHSIGCVEFFNKTHIILSTDDADEIRVGWQKIENVEKLKVKKTTMTSGLYEPTGKPSVKRKIIRLIVEHPNWDKDRLYSYISKSHSMKASKNTVFTIWFHTQYVLYWLRQNNLLKESYHGKSK